jgi:hypothetical protein
MLLADVVRVGADDVDADDREHDVVRDAHRLSRPEEVLRRACPRRR